MSIIRPFTQKISGSADFINFINRCFAGHLPNTDELKITISQRSANEIVIAFAKNNTTFAQCSINIAYGTNVQAACYYNPQKTVFYFNCHAGSANSKNSGAIIAQETNGNWSIIDGWSGKVWYYTDTGAFTYYISNEPSTIVDGKGLFAYHKEMNYVTGSAYKDLYKTDHSPINGLNNNVFVSADKKIFYGAVISQTSIASSPIGGSSINYYYPNYFFEALTEEG